MRTFCLASGSSGNSWYIEGDEVKILVDLGLSYSKSKDILASRGVNIENIDAIFISHEHSDHIAGLEIFLKNLSCDIYLSKGTFKWVEKNILNLNYDRFKFIKDYSCLKIGNINVLALKKNHDANEALNFVFENGKKIGIFTDMGSYNDEFLHIFKTLDIIYFELNYCEDFINEKKFTYNINYLNRLMSDYGHLGLKQVCNVLKEAARDNQKIILSHISENTNSYENAYTKIKKFLLEINKNPKLIVSFQGEALEWIE